MALLRAAPAAVRWGFWSLGCLCEVRKCFPSCAGGLPGSLGSDLCRAEPRPPGTCCCPCTGLGCARVSSAPCCWQSSGFVIPLGASWASCPLPCAPGSPERRRQEKLFWTEPPSLPGAGSAGVRVLSGSWGLEGMGLVAGWVRGEEKSPVGCPHQGQIFFFFFPNSPRSPGPKAGCPWAQPGVVLVMISRSLGPGSGSANELLFRLLSCGAEMTGGNEQQSSQNLCLRNTFN